MFGGRRGEVLRLFHGPDEAFVTDGALGEDDHAFAAAELGVRACWPRAIAHVESLGRPFVAAGPAQGRPILRIEAGWWRKLAYSARAAREIDALRPLNPADQGARWANFDTLWSIDPAAAVKASSFGAFQIMGFNHAAAGFSDPLLFLEAMGAGAGAQTLAFIAFIRSNAKLHAALRAGDPPAIALHYNGPRYAENRYDVKLRQVAALLDRGEAAHA